MRPPKPDPGDPPADDEERPQGEAHWHWRRKQGYTIAAPEEAAPRPLSDRECIEELQALVMDLCNRVWWLEAEARKNRGS